jgi:hypothetical protein
MSRIGEPDGGTSSITPSRRPVATNSSTALNVEDAGTRTTKSKPRSVRTDSTSKAG